MSYHRLETWINSNPKKLFLIDGFGAILSAFFLGVVLVSFESIFGIPKTTLFFLASIPCIFAIYDFCCYLFIHENIGRFLNIIAIANLIYCVLSIALAIYHRSEILLLAWLYITIEIIIVCYIAFIELKIAKNNT